MKLTVHEQNQATLDTGEDPCLFQAPRGLKESGESREKTSTSINERVCPLSTTFTGGHCNQGSGRRSPSYPRSWQGGSWKRGGWSVRISGTSVHPPFSGPGDTGCSRSSRPHHHPAAGSFSLPRSPVSRVGGVIHTAPLPGYGTGCTFSHIPVPGRKHRTTGAAAPLKGKRSIISWQIYSKNHSFLFYLVIIIRIKYIMFP